MAQSSQAVVALAERGVGDAVVASKARQILDGSNYLALRRLQCECHDGQLVLLGRVPTFYLKQMAQTLVRQIPQVRKIENKVDVAEFWN